MVELKYDARSLFVCLHAGQEENIINLRVFLSFVKKIENTKIRSISFRYEAKGDVKKNIYTTLTETNRK